MDWKSDAGVFRSVVDPDGGAKALKHQRTGGETVDLPRPVSSDQLQHWDIEDNYNWKTAKLKATTGGMVSTKLACELFGESQKADFDLPTVHPPTLQQSSIIAIINFRSL